MPGDSDSDIDKSSRSGKVIVLGEHQAAGRILDEIFSTDIGSPGFNALVARSAALGAPLLAAIVRRLDGFNPHSLEVLARVVAVYPDTREAAQTLKKAANDRRNSDRRRMGAVMALEQALGIQPPDDFLSTLREPVGSATGLLMGALDSSADNPAAMHDYLRALVFQPLDLLYSVLGMLAQNKGRRTVDVLRLLAFQPDPDLQLSVIEALSDVGTSRAIHALSLLELTLPDEPARAAGRALQKLRLSGVDIEPLQQAGEECRAWISAIDGRGDRVLWLLAPGEDGAPVLLGLLLNDISGVLDALGTSNVDRATLPAPGQLGVVHESLPFRIGDQPADRALGEPGGGYLQVAFDYALGLLQEAVRLNWETGTPLPVEYQLLNGAFWEYAGGLLGQQTGILVSGAWEGSAQQEAESDLLFSPLFDSWLLDSPAVDAVAREIATLDSDPPHELTDEKWHILLPALIRLAHEEFGLTLRVRYADRLKKMAEWLSIAGYAEEADLAARCAHTMLNSPPETNLFVIRLVQKGILVAPAR